MKQAFTSLPPRPFSPGISHATGICHTPSPQAHAPDRQAVHHHVGGDRSEGDGEKAGIERRPVAKTTSRIHHSLHRGNRVTSCTVAVARTESGPAYRTCGKAGSLWRIVPGAQVPQTCLKRGR